jgi:hypothetical protein
MSTSVRLQTIISFVFVVCHMHVTYVYMYICVRPQDSGPPHLRVGSGSLGRGSSLKSMVSARIPCSGAILLQISSKGRTLRSSCWFAEGILTLDNVPGENIHKTLWYLYDYLSGSSCRPKPESSKTWSTYFDLFCYVWWKMQLACITEVA